MISKKKKKKRSSPKLSPILAAKFIIQRTFQPKNRWSPKKKKIFTEIVSEFSSKIGNSNDFSAQNQVVSKKIKKKGLYQNWVWFFGQNRKFKRFFRPKSGDLQKKKVFNEIVSDFSAKIGISNAFSHRITTSTSGLWHPISFGGAVFNFLPKIGQKSNKNVRFCILHKPMGGSSPPAPPLATLLNVTKLFWLYFCASETNSTSQARSKPEIFCQL